MPKSCFRTIRTISGRFASMCPGEAKSTKLKKMAGARFKGILTLAYLVQHHGLFRQRTKQSDSDKFYAPTSPLQVYSGVLNEKIFNLDFLLALINDYWSLFDSHRVFFAIWLIINFHWKVLSEPSYPWIMKFTCQQLLLRHSAFSQPGKFI